MDTFQNFYDSILPGNYALTKSMELNKTTTSGTLWYTKKFIVFYNYIFLTDEIFHNGYIKNIANIFDKYISTLDESLKEKAELYFFPMNDALNLKRSGFLKFTQFASYNNFSSSKEKEEYIQDARRCYFTIMMGSGGQKGVKKLLKEAIETPGFVYSADSIKQIIANAAAESLMFDVNTKNGKPDKSLKYLLSDKAIKKAMELSAHNSLSLYEVKKIIQEFPMTRPKYKMIENDMIAFIRNERQILYYYGFFHSKSNGGTDKMEFSSLTPIGRLAVNANSDELLLIWEHQKLKMISQPATADIQDIMIDAETSEYFGISYTPYLDILGHIQRNNKLTFEEYQYIVSRRRHSFDANEWVAAESGLIEKINIIKAKVNDFGRKRDLEKEDSGKELKKYLLGIISNLKIDAGKNRFGAVNLGNGGASVYNAERLAQIIYVYERISEYKVAKYEQLFLRCERDLKKRYRETACGIKSGINGKVKIDWDLYNIRPDKFVMFAVVYLMGCIHLGIDKDSMVTNETVGALGEYCFARFNTIMGSFGIKSKIKLKGMLKKIRDALNSCNYEEFMEDGYVNRQEVITEYKERSAEDLMQGLVTYSKASANVTDGERTRNMSLVRMLKSYNLKVHSVNNMLQCECCGEETFITQADEPYVEYHHLIPFNLAYGPDHYLNLFALCPNCHRKIHHQKMDMRETLYENLNEHNYFKKSFEERLIQLKKEKILCSYHLEFLLAEKVIDEATYNRIAS